MGRPVVMHVLTGLGRGGAEHRLLAYLQARDRSCFEHTVVSLGPEDALAKRFLDTGVEVRWMGLSDASSLPGAARRLVKVLRDVGPSIVHSQLFHANVASRLVAPVVGAPPVVSGYASTDPRMSPWRRLADFATSRLAAHHVANCIAVADAVRRRNFLPRSKVTVIYPGRSDPLLGVSIDDVQRTRCTNDTPVVLSVGRLHPAKGHDVLLRALSILGRKATMAIAGDGPWRERLERMAYELGVASRVEFLGEVSDPSSLYREANLFVLPSRWEGLPGALVEAMFWALPIVATAVGGVPEAIEHRRSGFLVSPEEPELLAAAVRRSLDDPENGLRTGIAARETALRLFRIEQVAPRWEDLYRRFLEDEKPCEGALA